MTDQAAFPHREAENCCESVQGISTARKQNKYAAFFKKKIRLKAWFKKMKGFIPSF